MAEKKSSAGKILLRFCLVLFTLGFMLFVGVRVFALVRDRFYDATLEEYKEQERYVDVVKDARVSPAGWHYVMGCEEETGVISAWHAEYIDYNTGNITLVNLPSDLSDILFRETRDQIHLRTGDIPEGTMELGTLGNYVSRNSLGDYLSVVLDQELTLDGEYYLLYNQEDYGKLYENGTFSPYYQEKLKALSDEASVKLFWKELYATAESNLSYDRRMQQEGRELKLNYQDIYSYELPATGGTIKEESWSALKTQIEKSAAYTMSQKDYEQLLQTDSKDLAILVLNATNVPGLAGKTAERLTDAGYLQVEKGNYQGEGPISQTVIQTKKEGRGMDLLAYFPGASYEIVDKLPKGVKIQVILGSDAGE